jgi:hypothetical protein
MVSAIAAAELQKFNADNVPKTVPLSRTNSDVLGSPQSSSILGSSVGHSSVTPTSQPPMADLFENNASNKSSPSSSKVGGKAADQKDWSDDEDDDQPKKKKFVIKIKDTASQPATTSLTVLPTLSLSMPSASPAAPSGTRRRGAAAADAPLQSVSAHHSPASSGGAFGGAFNTAAFNGTSDSFSTSFSSPASDPFASGASDPFSSQISLSDRVAARVTQTVNAKFGTGVYSPHIQCCQ